MAKAKYKEYVERMLQIEKELFTRFSDIHDKYQMSPHEWQEQFNEVGGQVMETVRDYEDKLCRQSETAGYGSFSSNLSEKFNGEVRKIFPSIDRVGIILKKSPEISPALVPVNEEFVLKKIRLGQD